MAELGRKSVRLYTPRLLLRELAAFDIDYIAALLSDEQTMRFWPRPYTRAEAVDWIERQQARYQADGCAYWLALDRASNEPIGQAGVVTQRINDVIEWGLGYIIDKRYWRQGYATEAAAACLDFVFDTLDCPRAISLIRPENTPSIGVVAQVRNA